MEPEPYEAAGMTLAKQALALLQPGGQITVIVRDTATFPNPASDVQLSSFKKAIRPRATIGSVVALQVDPLRPVEVPPGDFFELIRKTPKGSVIVSFMGPPLLNAEQRTHLREIQPAIVAFCSGNLCRQVDLRELFIQGLLHAAVVSRRTPTVGLPPKDMQGWFDRSFVAITPENLTTLATAVEVP
jgi:hypothetical protein